MKFLEEFNGILQKRGTLSDTAREMKDLAGTRTRIGLLKGKQKILEQKMGARAARLHLYGHDQELDRLLDAYGQLERELFRLDKANIIEGVYADHPAGGMHVCGACGCSYPDELTACPECGNCRN